MKIFFYLLYFIPLIACAMVPYKDVGLSALQGGDQTCLIQVEGSQLTPGYAFLRKTEGDASGENLYLVGPITNCDRDFCVEYKIYGKDGEIVDGGSIPKNAFRRAVPWSKLLKRNTFELSDRGFWAVTSRVYWKDDNGNENVSVCEGEIRLKVLKKDYIPLHNVVNDSNFTWDFSTRYGERVKITTGMRTYVSKRK